MPLITLFDISMPASQLPVGITTSVGSYDTLNESIAKAAIKIKYINIYSTSSGQVQQPIQVIKKDEFGNNCLWTELPVLDPNQMQGTTLNLYPQKDIILDGTVYLQLNFTTDVRYTFYWDKHNLYADSHLLGNCSEDCNPFAEENVPDYENFFFVQISEQGAAAIVQENGFYILQENGGLILIQP